MPRTLGTDAVGGWVGGYGWVDGQEWRGAGGFC